jgi:hypothetical protein
MDPSPSHHESLLPVFDELHVAALHTVSPDQFRLAARADKVDFGLTVTKDVHMRRLMIVGKDHNPEARSTVDRDPK